MLRRLYRIYIIILAITSSGLNGIAQINTDQVMRIGRNTLYFEDYVLSIQYFNQVIAAKPYLAQPYFYRAIAKLNLDDYKGAEEDASAAIERNPFITDAYEVRGVARQNQGKPREAIEDYNQALEQLPENRGLMYNKALAQQESDDLSGASETYESLLKSFPGFDAGYIGRARLRLEQKDTVGALADVNKALELNKNAVNGYLLRADISINSHKDYQKALDDMNEAIRLEPQYPGFFINRAYIKYMLDDYFGAMADFDYSLQLDPANTAALFNRGMLRAEVHDTNKAIDDFSRVLALNPVDYKALYNRSMLYGEIGAYKEALADLGKVIEAFPDFAAAYFLRYDLRRRQGDMAAAKRDYDKSMALAKTRVKKSGADTVASGQSGDNTGTDGVFPELTAENSETQEQVKQRFTSLTTIDDNTRDDRVFNNKNIRGKVQDRNVNIELEPMFVVTYYTSPTELKQSGDYIREVDDLNYTRMLRYVLQVTNHEPQMSDENAIQSHFNSIDYYNSYISTHTPRAIDYFGRAMDLFTTRNYPAAVEDLNRAIALTPDFTIAYLVRSVARYRDRGHLRDESAGYAAGVPDAAVCNIRAQMQGVIDDLDTVIKLSPEMAIAYYNKGVVLAELQDYTGAISAFNKAIELKPDFGEAFYNRGYAYLRLGNKDAGISDLSKAGELGIVPSYNLLKRMTR